MTRKTSVAAAALLGAAVLMMGCRAPITLNQVIDARRLAADLHVQFTKAADAGNLAVMADADDDAQAAATQARQSTQAALRDVGELTSLLSSLGYGDERHFLDTFAAQFEEFRKIDAELLPLAVENSNLKAQRLSFGPSRDAAARFRAAVAAAAKTVPPDTAARADALAAHATVSILDILVLQAPHIAEAEDAAMTMMEAQMAASESAARRALDQLKPLLPPAGLSQLATASAALDEFKTGNGELIALSRRNSDVRSLALSLGRKRMITAVCDDQLRALEEALSKRGTAATR